MTVDHTPVPHTTGIEAVENVMHSCTKLEHANLTNNGPGGVMMMSKLVRGAELLAGKSADNIT